MKKTKKKAGFLLIKGETFPYDVIVCLGVSREELLEYLEARFEDALTRDEKEHLGKYEMKKGLTLRLENGAFILWVRHFPTTPEYFGFLQHEVFHTADLMLRKAGVALSDDSDEVFAYQIDWFTKRIYQEFKLI